jgi:hypothetical protein
MVPFVEVILHTAIDSLRCSAADEDEVDHIKPMTSGKLFKVEKKKVKGKKIVLNVVLFLSKVGCPVIYFLFVVLFFATGSQHYLTSD